MTAKGLFLSASVSTLCVPCLPAALFGWSPATICNVLDQVTHRNASETKPHPAKCQVAHIKAQSLRFPILFQIGHFSAFLA